MHHSDDAPVKEAVSESKPDASMALVNQAIDYQKTGQSTNSVDLPTRTASEVAAKILPDLQIFSGGELNSATGGASCSGGGGGASFDNLFGHGHGGATSGHAEHKFDGRSTGGGESGDISSPGLNNLSDGQLDVGSATGSGSGSGPGGAAHYSYEN